VGSAHLTELRREYVMAEKFTGTVGLEKGVDAALQAAVLDADKKKPKEVTGYEYTVKNIRGAKGFAGDTLAVTIETDF
jgi:hypothetical protein